jgi:hypothetical protein
MGKTFRNALLENFTDIGMTVTLVETEELQWHAHK